MKNFNILIAGLLMVSSFVVQASNKKDLKLAFKNLSVPARLQTIRDAEVLKPSPLKDQTPDSQIDIVEFVKGYCPEGFNYEKQGNNFLWPTIECEYTPDDGSFGGASPKFNCLFSDRSKKNGKKKYKVKYADPDKKYSDSEIVPTFLAALSAELIGFHTELYCPAKIVCKNCPSEHPWQLARASAPAGKQTFTIEKALVEIPVPAMNIKNPGPETSYGQGFDFNEMAYLSSDSQIRRNQIIEREAWLLWLNMLVDLDAFHFNQRIACFKGDLVNGEATCERSVLYTHDYGHAFFEKMQINQWEKIPALIQQTDGSCVGGLSADTFMKERRRDAKGFLISPKISEEARSLFLSRISLITDQQWMTVIEMSNPDQVSRMFNKVKPQHIFKVLKNKITEIEKTTCQSVDLKGSVLSEVDPL